MTLIEAIKTGKRFRRKGCNSGFTENRLEKAGYNSLNVLYEDILATDWEVEEEKIELTRHELDRALESAWSCSCLRRRMKPEGGDEYACLRRNVLKELGLSDD